MFSVRFLIIFLKIMLIEQHWLTECTKNPSPNFGERPDPKDISLLVIHCISLPPGEFGNPYIDKLFCNQLDPGSHPYFKEIYQLAVSAHILIKRSGEVVQYVPFSHCAWHAGKSVFEGREKCNDFSIGIELEGTEQIAYTDAQYLQLAMLINTLLKTYPTLSPKRIIGHSTIAPGRKTDPGDSFDWDRLFELVDN